MQNIAKRGDRASFHRGASFIVTRYGGQGGGVAGGRAELYIGGQSEGPRNNPRQILKGEETMKKPLWFVLLVSLLMPGLAMAQSAFDGTWKFDLKTAQFPKKPEVYVLQDGMYHCKTCVPTIDIKADGQDQKLTGHPYYDTMSIKVVDDRTIAEPRRKTERPSLLQKRGCRRTETH